MCDVEGADLRSCSGAAMIPVAEAVGMVLAHDITEIRKDEFKGRAFKRGHIVREEDIEHLRMLGKERLYVLKLSNNEIHEDDAAYALAYALIGEGVTIKGEPREGKITLVADRDGLLKVNVDALMRFNSLGEVMCASIHTNTPIKRGEAVAGTRAIPLVVKKSVVDEAVDIARSAGGVFEVRRLRRPKAGVVITGNEVYYGRVRDAFAPVIRKRIEEYQGEIAGIYYAPDDEEFIEQRLRELVGAGSDLLIITGGMSVDPDDITRFAIRGLGAADITYGSAVLPGAMFLVAYLNNNTSASSGSCQHQAGHVRDTILQAGDRKAIPVLGIPACAMYHKKTVFDLVLPRILSGERIGRRELAELGHGGLCLDCEVCRYPACPFGKSG
jgi:hypothetical protein